jgi:hypothetical protein
MKTLKFLSLSGLELHPLRRPAHSQSLSDYAIPTKWDVIIIGRDTENRIFNYVICKRFCFGLYKIQPRSFCAIFLRLGRAGGYVGLLKVSKAFLWPSVG